MKEQEKRIEKQTKDAIEVLGFLKKAFENKAKPRCKYARVRAGLFFAIKALEKQIPKKPIDKFMYVECPTCGNVEILDCGYCPACGQKLDWEEV